MTPDREAIAATTTDGLDCESKWPVVLRVKRKSIDVRKSPALVVMPKKGRLDGADGNVYPSVRVGVIADRVHCTPNDESTIHDLAVSLKRALPPAEFDQWTSTSCKRIRVVDLEPTSEDDKSLRVVQDHVIQVDDAVELHEPCGTELLSKEFGQLDVVEESSDHQKDDDVPGSSHVVSPITLNGVPLIAEQQHVLLPNGFDYYVGVADDCLSWTRGVDGYGFELVDYCTGMDFSNPLAFTSLPQTDMDDDDDGEEEDDSEEDSNAENYYANDYPDEDFENDDDEYNSEDAEEEEGDEDEDSSGSSI